MDKETETILANAFKNAKEYLKGIPSKRFKELQKGKYTANFGFDGLHTGNTFGGGDGVIQIAFDNIKNKADIQREINLQLEKFILMIEKELLK